MRDSERGRIVEAAAVEMVRRRPPIARSGKEHGRRPLPLLAQPQEFRRALGGGKNDPETVVLAAADRHVFAASERLHERLVDPEKAWKFRQSDLDDRARWDDYMRAYEDVLSETSTRWAPWYVVPADHNWVRNVAVARILVETLKRIDPRLPPPPALPAELVSH